MVPVSRTKAKLEVNSNVFLSNSLLSSVRSKKCVDG